MPSFSSTSSQPLQTAASAKPAQGKISNAKPIEPVRKMGHGWKPPKLEKYGTLEQPENLQYYTSRGNIPLQIAQDTVRNAPSPPPPGYRPKRRDPITYPKHYGNFEGGQGDDKRHNFDERFEKGQVPGGLVEYPVSDSRISAYDYSKPARALKDVERYDGLPVKARLTEAAPNNPGAYRAVTTRDKQLQGLNFHPEGDKRGNHRAYVGPLDKDGREQKQHHQKKSIFRVGTWK